MHKQPRRVPEKVIAIGTVTFHPITVSDIGKWHHAADVLREEDSDLKRLPKESGSPKATNKPRKTLSK